jgi:hypothetical protein
VEIGYCTIVIYCQRPRGLRLASAAVFLLGLRVRNPPGAWMSLVSVVCCQAEVSASGCSLFQRSPTECGSCVCVNPRQRKFSTLNITNVCLSVLQLINMDGRMDDGRKDRDRHTDKNGEASRSNLKTFVADTPKVKVSLSTP